MNCTTIFSEPVDCFVEKVRARSDELFVFQHIPKTAGSSTHFHLDAIPNGFHWLGNNVEGRTWEDFCELSRIQKFRLLRGHMKSQMLDELDQNQVAYQACCFLRNPIAQTISHFRYCHSDACPNHSMFRREYNNLSKFISEYLKPNFSTTYMIGHCDSIDEAIEKIKSRFVFVGLTEFYHTSMAIMMSFFGRDFVAQPRRNVTRSHVSVEALLTNDVEAQINEEFAIDIAVHDYFFQRFGMLAEQMVTQLSHRLPGPRHKAA